MLIKALIWLLLFASGAGAQGFVTTPSPLILIGYANVVGGATAVVTVANSVPANALIIVGSAETPFISAGAVTDSNGNTYSSPYFEPFGAATGFTKISFASANGVLNPGATITFTLGSGGALPTKNANVAAYYAQGYSTVNAAISVAVNGVSSTPSATTGVPVANQLFVAAVGGPTTIASFTQDTNWSALPKEISLSAPMLAMAALIHAPASAVTYAPTFGTSVRWGAVVLCFTP